MKKRLSIFIVIITLFTITSCSLKHKNKNSFALFKNGKVASIYISNNENPQIIRAVKDLQNDIEMVTNVKPKIIHSLENIDENVIIISSVNNPNIQKLQNKGKLDELNGNEHLTEAFLLKSIKNYSSNIKNALTVIGTDVMGTIYGIYEISERIGVSPLYWWCDVVPEKKSNIILENCLVYPKEPSVRYRGIFINDEEALTQWSYNTSPNPYNAHPSPEIYKRIFELLLRLKANAIWPAMMQNSSYFFEAKEADGTPINAKNAKQYGIYVGSSHCENMARNNFAEWHNWAKAHANMYDAKGVPVWDYTVNPLTIEAYWQERLDESKNYNMIYTLGIRGVHDSPFLYENMKNPTLEKKVALLQKVINRQREMIKETFGSEDAVPQVFIPYEEAAEIYNGETTDGKEKCEGIVLPEDVMMVWTEDNYSYARQLPNTEEQKRAGGNGIYYHLAYQGYPTSYDWLTTTPLPIVQEELRKVYNKNARQIWMVNVGDLKPAEMSLQFFMSLAYNINSYPKNTTKKFLQKSAKQQFAVSDKQAEEVANIITDFHGLTWPKKPEPMIPFWSWKLEKDWMYSYYSYANFGDEAQQQVNKAIQLEKQAKKIYDSLNESNKIPFWHLAYYPIRSTRLMLEKAEYYRKNIAYAKQGRFSSVNAYKILSENAEAAIQADLNLYKKMVNGKWNGIMDPYANYNYKERIFDVANIPNNLVYNEVFLEEVGIGIASVCEGQKIGNEKIELQFSSFENNQRFIDIFNKNIKASNWNIESNVDWITYSKSSGNVLTEERIILTVDWDKADLGINKATVTVTGTNGYMKKYSVKANKFDFKLKEKSYVEGNGFVCIEAEHYTAKHNAVAQWEEYENFGYAGSSMFLKGGTKVKDNLKENSARLEYSVYFTTKGTHYAELFRIPTLNEGKENTNEIAIGLNNEAPQVLSGVRKKKEYMNTTFSDGSSQSWTWHNNVLMQMEKIPFEITVNKPGYHTLKIYQINTDIGIDKLVICTNKQTKTAQKDAIIGALISYNTITEYNKKEVAALPNVDNIAEVTAYKIQEPLSNVKFNFAMYAMLDAFDYIPINQRHVYNQNKNQFGWRAEDVNNIGILHNESTERLPFWQRDGLTGKKETKFYAKLEPGTYSITYYMGDARRKEEMLYNVGKNFKMSFSINGKQLMDNETIISGIQKIDTEMVKINEEELLEVTVSGNWILNALEIKQE